MRCLALQRFQCGQPAQRGVIQREQHHGRMAVGGQPAQLSSVNGEISGFKVSADGRRVVLWADRDLR